MIHSYGHFIDTDNSMYQTARIREGSTVHTTSLYIYIYRPNSYREGKEDAIDNLSNFDHWPVGWLADKDGGGSWPSGSIAMYMSIYICIILYSHQFLHACMYVAS